MDWKPIKKSVTPWAVQPNLLDYEQTRVTFSWEAIQQELDGLPGGKGLNIAHEAVDRHANGPQRDNLAIRWLGKDGTVRDFTYSNLKEQSNRFANVLRRLGLGKGGRVFVLAGVTGLSTMTCSSANLPAALANLSWA
ncbi:MAG TPA: AMP-binding protein [Anaerolineae bacterium]|nr:AMP-binding protein [Anaerolineae bacterium]